jgi:hypothetical protein
MWRPPPVLTPLGRLTMDRRWRLLACSAPLQRGDIRVNGGDNGSRERTVSLADIAWLVVAAGRPRRRFTGPC